MKLANLQYPECFHDTMRSQSHMHSVAIGKAAEYLAFFLRRKRCRLWKTLLHWTVKYINCACINAGEIHIPHLLKNVDLEKFSSDVPVGE